MHNPKEEAFKKLSKTEPSGEQVRGGGGSHLIEPTSSNLPDTNRSTRRSAHAPWRGGEEEEEEEVMGKSIQLLHILYQQFKKQNDNVRLCLCCISPRFVTA